MVERRRRSPLILSFTKTLTDSYLNFIEIRRSAELGEGSFLPGAATSVNKRLSMVSGSPVLQNDIDASIDDGADYAVVVEIDDFIKALAELSPSLSLAELEKYEQLRDQFEGTRK